MLYIFQPQLKIENDNEMNISYTKLHFQRPKGTSTTHVLTEKWKWLHVSRVRLCQNKQPEQFPNLLYSCPAISKSLNLPGPHVFCSSYKKWRYLVELFP